MSNQVFTNLGVGIKNRALVICLFLLSQLCWVAVPVYAGAAPRELLSQFQLVDPVLTDKYKEMYKDIQTGDRFSPSNGAVSFAVTEVAIPGNFDIPVELIRHIPEMDQRTNGLLMWQFDVPRISAKYMETNNTSATDFGAGGGWRDGKNCTGSYSEKVVALGPDRGGQPTNSTVMPYGVEVSSYWEGKTLHIPGKTTEKFLENTIVGSTSEQITKSNYRVDSCIQPMPGAGINEGFIVSAPDGTRYTFNHFLSINTGLWEPNSWTPLRTYSKLVLVTHIEDRYGNSVDYHYNDSHELTSITSSDNREIIIEYESYTDIYGTKNRPKFIKSNEKTWVYEYSNTDPRALIKATLPDDTSWDYSYSSLTTLDTMYDINRKYLNGNYDKDGNNAAGACAVQTKLGVDHDYNVQITSPEGLITDYTFRPTYFGRSKVKPHIKQYPNGSIWGALPTYLAQSLNCNVSLALRKKVTYAWGGVQAQTWVYDYSTNIGTYDVTGADFASELAVQSGVTTISAPGSYGLPNLNLNSAANKLQAEDYRTVTITGPDNKIVYYVDRKFHSITEGSVVAEDYFNLSGSLLKRVEFESTRAEFIGTYWWVGGEYASPQDSLNPNLTQYRINKVNSVIKEYRLDGTDTYTTNYSNYDEYGYLGLTQEFNSFSGKKKFTRQEYNHFPGDRVFGLPSKTKVSADGITYETTDEIKYHVTGQYAQWHLPSEYLVFNMWKNRYDEFHTSQTQADALGQLKKITVNDLVMLDASGVKSNKLRYQTYSNYKRGKAQTITTNARYNSSGALSFSQVVNDDGSITQVTDLNGVTVNYGYNSAGLLTYIGFPAPWYGTLIEWSHNILGGTHTRQATQCKLSADRNSCVPNTEVLRVKNLFDVHYRVTETQEYDFIGDKTRYQHWRYDSEHRPLFTSYPSYSSGETQGTTVIYDALGRVTSQLQSGSSAQLNVYLKDNRTQTSDPVGNTTISQFLAYGAPSQSQPIVINSPESVLLTRNVNVFGDLLSTTQSGAGKQLTEYKAYDNQHRLCKTTRADSGVAIFTYDNLGRIITRAKGVAQGTQGTVKNCMSNVGTGDLITSIYDNLGDIYKINYPDTSPDLTYERDANGNLLRLTAGTVNQSFTYNIFGQPTFEQINVGNKTLSLEYEYNAARHLISVSYPGGLDRLLQNPNGFGQARSVIRTSDAQVYVKDVNYYANGAIDSFEYGNGIRHKTTLDAQQLPASIQDGRTGFSALNYSYSYDNNRRVTSITDNRNPAYSMSRLQYDGRGRLTNVVGAAGIGSSKMQYDTLDNITLYNSKDSSLTYGYNYSKNQLETVVGVGSAAKNYSFLYDASGNVKDNGARNFIYNLAGQMTESDDKRYTYDGYNRRVKELSPNSQDFSFYTQAGKLFYRETAQGGINYIYLGGRLIAKEGVLENSPQQHYRPFGSSIEGEKDDVGFTGHKFDKALELTYMQARYYDPVIGRFMQPDPIGSADQFNLYAYVGNDPINMVDPTGKTSTPFTMMRTDQRTREIARTDPAFASQATAYQGAAVAATAIAITAVASPVGALAVSIGVETGTIDSPVSPRSNSADGVKLEKQLASEAQVGQLANGGGTVISQPAKQADRIAAQTGANPANIQKVSSDAHIAKDGQQVQTHSFRDASTNELIEPKTIIDDQK